MSDKHGLFDRIWMGTTALLSSLNPKTRGNSDQMLRDCSWNGDGKDVNCAMCGDDLDASSIGGMDEDGNGYCRRHTKGGVLYTSYFKLEV
jgi:hypothetical protein